MSSFARLAPSTTKYYLALAPRLHQLLTQVHQTDKRHYEADPMLVYSLVPDLTIYTNLWLTLATFAALQPGYQKMTTVKEEFKVVAQDLIKIFNSNQRWNATEINLKEAANVAVAIAILKVGNERFIGDVADIIRMLVGEEAEARDLPNLVKSSFYMRNFKYSKDLYSHVHAAAVTLHDSGEIQPEIFETLR